MENSEGSNHSKSDSPVSETSDISGNDKNEQLVESCVNNDIDNVVRLLDMGADVHVTSRGKYGNETPLFVSIRLEHIEIVKLLVNHDITTLDYRLRASINPLHIACMYNEKPDIIEFLLGLGKLDIDESGMYGSMAIHYAADREKTEFLDILKKYGATMNLTKNNSENILDIAIARHSISLIKYLYDSHSESLFNDNLMSYLRRAVSVEDLEILRFLVEYCNIDINMKDDHGYTILDSAIFKDVGSMAVYLWKANLEPRIPKTSRQIKVHKPRMLKSSISCGEPSMVIIDDVVYSTSGNIVGDYDSSFDDEKEVESEVVLSLLDLKKAAFTSIIPRGGSIFCPDILINRSHLDNPGSLQWDDLTIENLVGEEDLNNSFVAIGAQGFCNSGGYFEITILEANSSSSINIGVAKDSDVDFNPHTQSVVFETLSQGHFLLGKHNIAKKQELNSGDVFGCGINYDRTEVWFTKNGVYMGPSSIFFEIFDDEEFVPVIIYQGCIKFRANFGNRPFEFDFIVPTLHWKDLGISLRTDIDRKRTKLFVGDLNEIRQELECLKNDSNSSSAFSDHFDNIIDEKFLIIFATGGNILTVHYYWPNIEHLEYVISHQNTHLKNSNALRVSPTRIQFIIEEPENENRLKIFEYNIVSYELNEISQEDLSKNVRNEPNYVPTKIENNVASLNNRSILVYDANKSVYEKISNMITDGYNGPRSIPSDGKNIFLLNNHEGIIEITNLDIDEMNWTRPSIVGVNKPIISLSGCSHFETSIDKFGLEYRNTFSNNSVVPLNVFMADKFYSNSRVTHIKKLSGEKEQLMQNEENHEILRNNIFLKMVFRSILYHEDLNGGEERTDEFVRNVTSAILKNIHNSEYRQKFIKLIELVYNEVMDIEIDNDYLDDDYNSNNLDNSDNLDDNNNNDNSENLDDDDNNNNDDNLDDDDNNNNDNNNDNSDNMDDNNSNNSDNMNDDDDNNNDDNSDNMNDDNNNNSDNLDDNNNNNNSDNLDDNNNNNSDNSDDNNNNNNDNLDDNNNNDNDRSSNSSNNEKNSNAQADDEMVADVDTNTNDLDEDLVSDPNHNETKKPWLISALDLDGHNESIIVEFISLDHREEPEKIGKLLNNPKFSDIKIVFTNDDINVGPQYAHKAILKCRSILIADYLNENQSCSELVVNEPSSLFIPLLNAIYCDCVDLDNESLRQNYRLFILLVEKYAPDLSQRLIEQFLMTRVYAKSLLHRDLGKLLLQPEYSDISFNLQDVIYPAHKCIVGPMCQYFDGLISDESTIEINDANPGCFLIILRYLYSGVIDYDEINAFNINDLTELASRYNILKLKNDLQRIINHNINKNNYSRR